MLSMNQSDGIIEKTPSLYKTFIYYLTFLFEETRENIYIIKMKPKNFYAKGTEVDCFQFCCRTNIGSK